MFKDEYLKDGEKFPELGPSYFEARDVANSILKEVKWDFFDKIIKEASDRFYVSLQSDVENFIQSDTRSNIQGHIYRMVDNTVSALLTGEKWAFHRYVHTRNFNGEKIRKKIMETAPEEIKLGRIADLEEENRRLEKEIAFYKSCRG